LRRWNSSVNALKRLGGWAAIGGGAMKLVAAFIPYVPQSACLESLYAAIDAALLFGLIAVYLAAAARIGWIGLVSFVIALTALASILGPDPVMFDVNFYEAGGVVFSLGLAVLSVQLLRSRMFTIPSVLWIATVLIGTLLTLANSPLAFIVSGITLSIGFIVAGYKILKDLGRESQQGAGLSFNHVTIGCNDLAASTDFYRLIGLNQIVSSDANHYARFEAANDATLSIHGTGITGGSSIIYLEHPAIDEYCGSLAAQGVIFDYMPRNEKWGWREARLRDPAGNVICIYRAGDFRQFPPWRIA
jgi:catechol 2,3-dioxygenase-like lactoylglutathione lyase family enzyme